MSRCTSSLTLILLAGTRNLVIILRAGTWSCNMVEKLISDERTLQKFKKSDSYRRLLEFIRVLAEGVVGKKLTDHGSAEASPLVQEVVAALGNLSSWVEEIPPATHAVRYGNPAFKLWQARLQVFAPQLMRRLLSSRLPEERVAQVADELAAYLTDAFGNATRIDYGTGHELSFVAWLFCLEQLELLGSSDRPAVVLVLFSRYIELMRQLQTTYWLEPAGSHGVWGLDDYHFLPFLFGASQLVDHPDIRPGTIHEVQRLEEASPKYLYLGAVLFIRKVKKGHFGEHSPMLNDISSLDSWARVATGLLRMYEGEVLGKLPVVQHLLFGTLILPF